MRLIDADELMARLRNDPLFHLIEPYNIEGVIIASPTIEAEPVRRGRWLVTPYTDYDDTYECSVCGNGWVFIEGTPKDNGANYCPNCGAKMEEQEFEEPEINPCRGCFDYDGEGGCKSNGACGARMEEQE